VTKTAAPDARGDVRIDLNGRLTAYTAQPIWRSALETLARNPNRPIIIDASGLEYADDVGIAFLFDLIRRERPASANVEIRGLASNLAALVHGYEAKDFSTAVPVRAHLGIFEHAGRSTVQLLRYLEEVAAFVAECGAELRRAFTRRSRVNWGDVLDLSTEAGANGVPVVLLIGFLMGIIVAFQAGLVAKQFGAVLFVVNGVGFALLRELGPLMTAIVVAGRTGAAFAAQIGTQKVNEEVNAISTFGLSPIAFLVLPRLIAAVLVVPLLVVLADIVGLFGAALVMARFEVSFQQFYNQLVGAVGPGDFLIGVLKGAVFGLTIAIVGCQRGLTTGAGATSVGRSTTSAVVTSIVLIIVIDGIFAVFTV
jgi:phospholipid/cholesterol/gamma-HCH transport system permease protein